MNDAAEQTPKPGFAARCARGLGAFNIAYGILGLVSAAIIHFAFPPEMNPLPDSMMIASSVASITAIVQGVLLRIYGPAVTGFVGRRLAAIRSWTVTTTHRIAKRGKTA